MRYPRRLLTPDEEVLTQLRPHWRVLLPALCFAMLLAAGAGLALAALDGPWDVVTASLTLPVWLLVSGRRVVAWWFTAYVLTSERIIVRRGMVTRTGHQIPLESIVDAHFSQSVVGRVLGYGDVLIASASSEGQSRLVDVPRPEEFKSEVYRARELRSLALSHGGTRQPRDDDALARLERLADLLERGHLTRDEFESSKRRLLGRPDDRPST